MKRMIYFSMAIVLVLGLIPTQPAAALCPTGIAVSSSADSGAGTLREAIASVCSGGTITFGAGLSGNTILLGSTLELNQNVTIDGSGLASAVILDGQSTYRVFTIGTDLTISLRKLTIQNGSSGQGGGTYNAGFLTVSDSTFQDNAAQTGGGIFDLNGSLSITHTTFLRNSSPGNGGAIFYHSSNSLAVTNSTFESNSAAYGGAGIRLSSGGGTVTSSTFSGNSALTSGSGGGIEVDDDTLTVTNSTFDGNSAYDGGGITNYGTLNLKNSTFSGNIASTNLDGGGAAVYNEGVLNFANNILANSSSGGDCLNYPGYGTIGVNTNNLVEDGGCSASLNGDPHLAALADNGGPTRTMALLVGSPAIDAGETATCANLYVSGLDQRGVSRPQGFACDIGAYELDQAPSVVSILRASANPSSATSVDFTVTFNEAVSGVNTDDFSLTTSGAVTGALVATVSGGARIYTVSVNTGTGNGTLRLDLVDDDSILDATLNPLGGTGLDNGSYSAGEVYGIQKLFQLFMPIIWR